MAWNITDEDCGLYFGDKANHTDKAKIFYIYKQM